MILFHGSNIVGLTRLEPRKADADRPYVYLTTLEVIAALYLCNAVERPYYWFPYGFDNSGVPVYHELYPRALRQVSQGVTGCIYRVEASENEFIPFKDIPCARLGTVQLDVIDSNQITDAYDLLTGYIKAGRLKLSRYEDKTSEQLEWWYNRTAEYMYEKNMYKQPDCSYTRFVREKLPRAWELLLKRREQ